MARTFRLVIDQLHDDLATVLVEWEGQEHRIVVPRTLLSPRTREGQVFRLTIEADEAEEAHRRAHVAALLEKLKSKETAE